MRLVGEAGTDGAMVALFDPEALPEDFDRRYEEEPVELLERLQSEGRLFWTETGADGAFLLHLYLDEPVPGSLAPYCRDPVELPAFQAPGGALWFSGAEYVFHRDDAQMRKYPHMGTRMEIPAGVYHARLLRVEYPEDHVEERVKQAVGARGRRLVESVGCLAGTALALTLGACLAMFASRFSFWSLLLGAAAVLAWIGIIAFVRSSAYRAAREQSTAIQRDFPLMVAEFRSRRCD